MKKRDFYNDIKTRAYKSEKRREKSSVKIKMNKKTSYYEKSFKNIRKAKKRDTRLKGIIRRFKKSFSDRNEL